MSDEKKYRVRLCYDVKGWAYFRRCEALQKYAPDDFEVTIGPDYGSAFKKKKHDLVLQLCYPYVKQIARHVQKGYPGMVLVTGVNVAWREVRAWWANVAQYSDWIVLNSQAAFHHAEKPPKTCYISNGVDREQFQMKVAPEARTPRALSIGSQFHKGNKGFTSVLVEVAEKLKPHGIEADFRCVNSHSKSRMNAGQMCDWYNTGTIYVVASQAEGTPNPAIEASSCGCVPVATAVGNMPELIEHGHNGYIVDRQADAIVASIVEAQGRYVEMSAAMQIEIEPWHWGVRGRQYFDLFRTLIDERRNGMPQTETATTGEAAVAG